MRARKWHNEFTCLRHSRPGDVISPENPRTETMLTNVQLKYGVFWNGRCGYEYGPGFMAWSSDCPVGSRLRITVELLPPLEEIDTDTDGKEPNGTV